MTASENFTRRRTARLSAGSVCVVLALTAVLAGCGTESGDGAGAAAPTTPPRSAEPSSASPAPTRSSASPSPTAVKRLKVSTPAELRGCADGRCTVVVAKGTEIPFREGPFTVSAVGAGGVDLTSVDATGFTTNLLGQRPDQGGPSTVDDVSIAVLTIAGDTAKLHLFPAK